MDDFTERFCASHRSKGCISLAASDSFPGKGRHMSSHKLTQATDIRMPSRLDRWKVAIAIGAAVTLSPVIVLVLVVALATALPVLPLLATLFVGFWLRNHGAPAPALARRPLGRAAVLLGASRVDWR
jgi:hypothetical protein